MVKMVAEAVRVRGRIPDELIESAGSSNCAAISGLGTCARIEISV